MKKITYFARLSVPVSISFFFPFFLSFLFFLSVLLFFLSFIFFFLSFFPYVVYHIPCPYMSVTYWKFCFLKKLNEKKTLKKKSNYSLTCQLRNLTVCLQSLPGSKGLPENQRCTYINKTTSRCSNTTIN